MRKLILILVLAIVAIAANAQQKITNSKTFRVIPANADTINLATVTHNYFYVANYATKFKVQVDLDSVAGDPAVQVILRKSMDYNTWVNVDTVNVTDVSTNAISDLIEPYTPYIDVQATGITNAQTTKLTYTILIEKNP